MEISKKLINKVCYFFGLKEIEEINIIYISSIVKGVKVNDLEYVGVIIRNENKIEFMKLMKKENNNEFKIADLNLKAEYNKIGNYTVLSEEVLNKGFEYYFDGKQFDVDVEAVIEKLCKCWWRRSGEHVYK